MARKVWTALMVLALLAASGCWFRGPGGVRREVEQVADLDLKREFTFQAGRPTLLLARAAVRIAGKSDKIRLKGVRRIEVGVYEVDEPEARWPSERRAPSLCSARFDGWEPLVRICEPEEHVVLFVRPAEQSIRGLLVMVQESDEVVIVRARGKLDRVLRGVMELADEETESFLARRGREGPEQASGSSGEYREPRIAVCEGPVEPAGSPVSPGSAEPAEGPGCVDPAEARERVLAVARLLSPDDDMVSRVD